MEAKRACEKCKRGDGKGSKQDIQTKGNCCCKLTPFLTDIDKFQLQSKAV